MTLPHSVFQMTYCQSEHDIAAFCVSNDVLSSGHDIAAFCVSNYVLSEWP